jgi:hypothetical protein
MLLVCLFKDFKNEFKPMKSETTFFWLNIIPGHINIEFKIQPLISVIPVLFKMGFGLNITSMHTHGMKIKYKIPEKRTDPLTDCNSTLPGMDSHFNLMKEPTVNYSLL